MNKNISRILSVCFFVICLSVFSADKYRFDVANGALPASGILSTYDPGDLQIIDGDNEVKALHMTHTSGNPYISITDSQLVQSGSGLIFSEWKMKYISGVSTLSGFEVVLKPRNTANDIVLCPIKFFADKIEVPWGTINLSQSIQNQWIKIRFVLDVEKEFAVIWLDGEKIGEGAVSAKTSTAGIFFGDGSSSVAGEAEIEYLEISTSSAWDFDFNVLNGTLPTTDVSYTYDANDMQIVSGDNGVNALKLTHTSGNPVVNVLKSSLTQRSAGILLSEWKMKYNYGVNSLSGFAVVFKPRNVENEIILFPIKFYSDKIEMPWGTVNLSQSIQDCWVTFRLVFDIEKQYAVLWLDNDKITEGNVSNKTTSSGIFFGDGSSAVEGQAEIEYLKITTANLFSESSDIAWYDLKKQALNQQRLVIHNNDGCDAVYFPASLAANEQNFINQRLINVLNTNIDALSYCPLSSGFGYLTSETTAGDQLTVDPPNSSYRNVTDEFLQQSTDPLKLSENFCTANGIEFIVSLRCNDTHDTSHTTANPYFLFPPYKTLHPEFLMGSYTNRPSYCAWSAVDFTHSEIRDRFVAIAKELISNYSLDCLELDFCRHLQYFKSVADGGEASTAEQELMTECIRKIRNFAEVKGRERQNPVLISIRVPDSAGASKAAGLDIENWMSEDLIDILIAGFYMRLNPWSTTATLCDNYGVKFYPSMDESRITETNSYFDRSSLEADNARMTAALQAGADGIYFFNRYGSTQTNNMTGSMDDLRLRNKSYFVTYRNDSLTRYMSTGNNYNNLRNLSPENIVSMTPGVAETFYVEIGDDFTHPDVVTADPEIVVSILMSGDSGNKASIYINDNNTPLQLIEFVGNQAVYSAPSSLFVQGRNKVEITAAASCEQDIKLIDFKIDVLFNQRQATDIEQVAPNYNFRFDVADGTLPTTDVSYSYDAANMQIVSGDGGVNALQLTHLTGYQLIDIKNKGVLTKGGGILSAKWKMKYLSGLSGLSGFHMVFKPEDIDGQIMLCALRIFDDKIEAPWGTVNLSQNIQNCWVTFQVIIDVEKEHAVLLMDEQYIGEGAVTAKTTSSGIFFGDGSSSVAGQAQIEYLEICRTPVWQFKFDVADGNIADLDNITYNYDTNNMQVVNGDAGRYALQLDHTTGTQLIQTVEPELVENSAGILLAEWKMKYLNDYNSKSGFQVVFKPKNQDSEIILCIIKFYSDRIEAPWGTINLSQSIQNSWETFKFVLDLKQEKAVIWQNGAKIGEGAVNSKTATSGIFFGDGSSSVEGQAQVEYFKITTAK